METTSENQVIIPTVGLVVHFYPAKGDPWHEDAPLNAHIAAVHGDRCINVMVSDPNGAPFPAPPTSVTLVQPGDKIADSDACRCQWMPYQVKKSTGSESGEEKAGIEVISEQPAEAATEVPPAETADTGDGTVKVASEPRRDVVGEEADGTE